MSALIGEDAWEQLVVDRMVDLDWRYTPGAEVAPGSGSGSRGMTSCCAAPSIGR